MMFKKNKSVTVDDLIESLAQMSRGEGIRETFTELKPKWSDKVKRAAAKARVAADKKRHVETPDWIKDLAND